MRDRERERERARESEREKEREQKRERERERVRESERKEICDRTENVRARKRFERALQDRTVKKTITDETG